MTQQTPYGEPIVTGEAVVVELRPAGVGSRGIALAIDFAVQYALLLLLLLFAAKVVGSADTASGSAILLVGVVAIWLGYPVALETFWRGRTLGKAAMGLRVARDDGGPIRFRHAFARGLVGVVVDRPGFSLGLLALVPMLVSARSKRLGDFAAGTVVVQERVPSKVAPPPAMPPQLEAWAAELDLSPISDSLALELRHFLARSSQLSPWAREGMGNRLLAELSAQTPPPPPGTPAWAYFSAVLAERRRREIDRLTAAAAPARVDPGPAQPGPAQPGPDAIAEAIGAETPAGRPTATPPAPGPFAPPA